MDTSSSRSRSSPAPATRQTILAEAARLGLTPGVRVGLFGGSFNPAHRGHLAVAEAAMRACALDRVVWLVTPGNPLKDAAGNAPLEGRIAGAEALAGSRSWLRVSGIEAQLGTRYTADTLAALQQLTRAHLVWIMGADSLASFHRWRDWRAIARRVPILVLSRPGQTLPALTGRAARALSGRRIFEPRALPTAQPPAWCYLHAVHEPVSATAIRAERDAPT